MPELPEVETTVRGLNKKVVGLVISDIWTDLGKKKLALPYFKHTMKDASFFPTFKKSVVGSKIKKVTRKAKNILIHLDNGKIILVHMKMTGHLLFGTYKYSKDSWDPISPEGLKDPFNRFIHIVFTFSNGKHLAMSDARKFGKVALLEADEIDSYKHLSNIGPEPLLKSFDIKKFKERLNLKNKKPIKTVLMDQEIIAGIGNIYSDEMLWLSGISPERSVKNINKKELAALFKSMKLVLSKGIDFGGDSMSDYRNIDGLPGNFQNHHNVYRKKGHKCGKKGCLGVILRKVIGGRSAHFCSKHQKLEP
jgi:formamidopyrimidine-DNA glycosylase